ncbi:MAG: RNA ligase family protein [Bacteroidia bacterium]|nr:RNA ligase family protein [Bacteroidia bacterium]
MNTSKYGRTYHFPFSPGTSSDDKVLSAWQSLLEHEIIITEKLDGENTCLKQSGVYARSHVAPTQNPWAGNMWDIWKSRRNSLGELEIFGENLYGLHSIEYQKLPHHFFIFAIRDGVTWLSWEEVVFYAGTLELPVVPVYETGRYSEDTLKAAILSGMTKGSAFGETIEGFVCRNSAAFDESQFTKNVLKYVRKNHIQTDIHWTKNWKRAKLWFEYPQQ